MWTSIGVLERGASDLLDGLRGPGTTYTEADGWCWFFGAIDHFSDDIVGWHTAKLGDRRAALEPMRQGVRHAFGRFGKDVASRAGSESGVTGARSTSPMRGSTK